MTKTNSNNKTKVTKASSPHQVKAAKPTSGSAKSAFGGGKNKKDDIYMYLCQQHVMDIIEVDTLEVSLAVGNRNPRSEGFASALKELKNVNGWVTNGSKKGMLRLTDKGIASMRKDMEVSKKDPEDMHKRYIEFVQQKCKMGGDKVPLIWEILKDRKGHSVKDIAASLGYNNPRSFGNTKIIATMMDMGLIQEAGKKGVVKFTGKVPA